ncbi:MAG: hypothetical protein SGI89_15030 [bacterium]|nr:hypothetical protein [bacterium]
MRLKSILDAFHQIIVNGKLAGTTVFMKKQELIIHYIIIHYNTNAVQNVFEKFK